MTWTRYIFKEHRTHVVPKRLASAVLDDITTFHGAELQDFGARSEFQHTAIVSEWGIDLGGMWPLGAPVELLHLRGLAIEVPSHHVEYVIANMRRLVPQRFMNGGDLWYGLPHWHHAFIMLPQHYLSLLAQLVKIAPRAKERYEAFDASREQPRTVPIITVDGTIVQGIVPP